MQAQTLFEQSLKSWLRLLNLRPGTHTLAPWHPPGGVGSCLAPSARWQGWDTWGPARSLLCQDPSSRLLPQSCPPEGHPSLNGVGRGRPVKVRTTHPLTSQILLPGGHVFTLATSHPSNSERGEDAAWVLPDANSRPFPDDPQSPPSPAHLPRAPFPSQLCTVGWGGLRLPCCWTGVPFSSKSLAKAAGKG